MKIVVLTGAGISQESGIQTFRGTDGLWEGHPIQDVATYSGFQRNPQLVLDFYNARRRAALEAEPNYGHKLLAQLEEDHEVVIITQNIDNLHERALSSHVIHIHGSIFQVRGDGEVEVYPRTSDCNVGDLSPRGNQLRPNVVWFGEAVLHWAECVHHTIECDIFIVCGTSAQVYPAASLIGIAKAEKIFVVDPNPPDLDRDDIIIFKEPASIGLQYVVRAIKELRGF